MPVHPMIGCSNGVNAWAGGQVGGGPASGITFLVDPTPYLKAAFASGRPCRVYNVYHAAQSALKYTRSEGFLLVGYRIL